jgi:hypothetical protein
MVSHHLQVWKPNSETEIFYFPWSPLAFLIAIWRHLIFPWFIAEGAKI